ncbi:hypothetical protein OEIGOIKO_06018 [Streptomyces chrestomyceticus JCM 4735]|uniref:Lipoprotein n=1 Tax=Streptomyces chrestomyceticus JCM 4735 TaxID=1306181 RepID=A0A7U9L0F9_9ACTN|nr:hypothetical protein [Streptomyces chrestomyceticus]GCD38206.1 hypothetical protein OEIGOIKO_06018 [Streptomyces chrestomyceticus JCM 4735]
MSASTTVRTARRRTLRVAAAALVAAAGLSLTACSGADATGTKAAGRTDMGTVAESRHAGPSAGSQGAEAKAGAVGEQAARSKAGAPVRTVPLADGISKAEIYKLGDQHYRAKIVARGDILATLETNQRDAGLDANDMFVVLSLDGTVHSWMGGGHQGPGTFKLAGGWTAKVTKVGELHYRAQILGRGGVVYGTADANQQDAGVVANGVYIVLSSGGVISAHA